MDITRHLLTWVLLFGKTCCFRLLNFTKTISFFITAGLTHLSVGQNRTVRIKGPVRLVERPETAKPSSAPLPLLVPPFNCANKVPGFYADVPSACKVYHICTPDGQHHSSLCGVGTIFNQRELVCDHWYNYDCAYATQDSVVNRFLQPFKDS